MKLAETWFTGVLLGGLAVGATCETVAAQTWQPARPTDDGVTQAQWDQRILKRPQQPLKWQAAGQSDNASGQDVQLSQPASQYRPAAGPNRTANSYQMARRSSYDGNVFDASSAPQEPAASGRQRPAPANQPEVIPPGEMQFEPMASQGAYAGAGDCAACGEPGGECGVCDARGQPASDEGCNFGYELFDGQCGGWLRNFTVAAGVQGFKGPLDRGVNGNFGFNEGLNFGGPLGDPWGCGYQIGANFVQSDFADGQQVRLTDQTSFRIPARNQNFVTAGIFRRALCGGFQGGIAYDYLHDNYFEQFDLQQIRSETGYVINDRYEIGYYGAYGVGTAQPRVIDGKLDPTDMFVVYLRHNFENGGDGRIWGGVTGNGDGLVGADLWVPLARGLALQNRINYLIPKSDTTSQRDNPSSERESWGLTVQLVWYPGQMALCQHKNLFRPMFNVADNSLFMVDRLAH